jgi:hypothetical protein
MTRENLIESDRELRIGALVHDGRAIAEVREKRGAEIQIEYDDGDCIWLQDNRFQYDDSDETRYNWRTV